MKRHLYLPCFLASEMFRRKIRYPPFIILARAALPYGAFIPICVYMRLLSLSETSRGAARTIIITWHRFLHLNDERTDRKRRGCAASNRHSLVTHEERSAGSGDINRSATARSGKLERIGRQS